MLTEMALPKGTLAALSRNSASGETFTPMIALGEVSNLDVLLLHGMGYLEEDRDPHLHIGLAFRLSFAGWRLLATDG